MKIRLPTTDVAPCYFRSMSEPDSDVGWFIRQVRARSWEHSEAMPVVFEQGWYSVAVGILRQELDSMIRVIYLLRERDRERRADLIRQAVSGQKWKVRDKEMVEAARRLPGYPWVRQVYKFGCGFIHLSRNHDYQARDPFRALSPDQRRTIAEYLREHHDGEVSAESAFDDIIGYVPMVLGKIAFRLDGFLDDLDNNRDIPGNAPRVP